MLLAALSLSPALALDVSVSHAGLTVNYQLEPGESVSETWNDVLTAPTRRSRRRAGDLRVHLALESVSDDHLQLIVQIDEVWRRKTLTVAQPTLLMKAGTSAEFLTGGEVSVVVETDGAEQQTRYVAYGTRILAGPSTAGPVDAPWAGWDF